MHQERPADALGCLLDAGPVVGELLAVGVAQGLHAVADPALGAFGSEKLHAALVGQCFLGGVQHLDQMALHVALRHLTEPLGDHLGRIEEVAERE